ncbi:MAG: DNA-directed RNA polymerase subunit beta', partial [Clostridia bacterium]|nr:DNA-directed RNA polymerase subunit beta' [Clostridia bacterium]
RGRPVTGPGNRPLKSLSDMLRGKQGRFRQNLLGKRVDYSGRSVIVVGPELKFYQCGLPKEMALELFKPFVMKKLVQDSMAPNIKGAKRMVERVSPQVWDVLEDVIKEHPVMLNRAPTLHRLGIQAFEPVLVEGRALKIHPLVCTAYNADFDGDQMAVHVPLSIEAQAEARFLMLSNNNILKPSDGKPVVGPSQDMVIGAYYMTVEREHEEDKGKVFCNPQEAIMAYQTGALHLQSPVKIRFSGEFDGKPVQQIYLTTVGRVLFNEVIPQNLGYVDRNNAEECLKLEIDFTVDRKALLSMIDRCYRSFGNTRTVTLLDGIKNLGFRYSTKGAVTVSVFDLTIPKEKKELVESAEKNSLAIDRQFRRGFITEDERYRQTVETWQKTTHNVTKAMENGLDRFNPVYMMSNSGARGSIGQLAQLAGMRGMVSDPTGRVIELPVRANYREGLTILEYFISSHGARKGLADTALRTADSGYLTRRMVDVSQDVIIREEDCFASAEERVRGMNVTAITVGDELIESLEDRIAGRVAAEDVADPNTGEILVPQNEMISSKAAKEIIKTGLETVAIRTVLTCRCNNGVCAKCYGNNLTHGRNADIGEAVGIMAAQSIGEPGTQLTMRTFHTGGVASASDITAGLPRVEELFEARKPKGQAIVTEIPGTIAMVQGKKKLEAVVTNEEGESQAYTIPYGAHLLIQEGQSVEAGDVLTAGSINPHDILQIRGLKGVQAYLLQEVQMVYRRHAGVTVGDKHIEIIIRQMLRKVRIEEAGETSLLPGELVDIFQFEKENETVIENGGQPAVAKRVLLGITKAALATDSFLSAASFQETTRVLTEAAIKGKVDPLMGLKENVIIGKLIPAGTGLPKYRDTEIV